MMQGTANTGVPVVGAIAQPKWLIKQPEFAVQLHTFQQPP